jgi:hypothetical protein
MLMLSCLLALSSCASLPDLKKAEGNMDRMTYYMGVTASSMYQMTKITGRMANNMEKMERKANGMMQQMGESGKSAERSIQNYGQAFIDNDRALIKSLRGIKSELAEIKEARPLTGGSRENADQARVNMNIGGRLEKLEVGVEALSAKVKKMEQKKSLN